MAQIDDLNAAVATMQQSVTDLQARDAQVVAGVQALQQEVSNLQAQVAANQPVDLSGITTQVNSLASALGGVDVESTDVPTPAPPA